MGTRAEPRGRKGTPRGTRLPLWSRLSTKIEVGTACWEWTGARYSNGYGMLGSYPDAGHSACAHRVVYEALVGPIPEGLTLDHLCRNKACVNPDHLEPVTQRVNTLRGDSTSAKNARKTHCIHGHEFTPENTIRKGHTRACRTCQSEYQRRLRERRRKPRVLAPHCRKGHEFTEENTYWFRGYRYCRECRRAHSKARGG